MLSEGNAVHPVAQVHAVQSKSLYDDGSKNPNHYCDKTHTDRHSKCHYPVARILAVKSPMDAASNDIGDEDVQNTEAEDYRCVNESVPLQTGLINDRDIDAMIFRDTLKQRLHALTLFPVPLRTMAEVHVSPPYRHIFGRCSVEAQMPSIT